MTESLDVTSPRVLNALLQEYGLQPRRRFGQNFLIDGNIAQKIVGAAEIKENEAVVEVGPGAGALTLSLARSGVPVLVLEIDRGFLRLINDLVQPWPHVQVIEGDALCVDWRKLIDDFAPGRPIKLVSNLPYNISGPFMYSLFECGFPFARAVLMFQKEVAGRLVAGPGDSDYGSLSVLCAYYTEARILFDVSKNVFWPRPKIGSAVLRLNPREHILKPEKEPILWKLVKTAFQQRRKTILNGISSLFPGKRDFLIETLLAAGIEPGLRPEELGVGEFALLTRIIYNNSSKLS
ncbi:MAG: 16S rRNA (adenine(1518)-N(6)/adenine(1519)-N(6))-dimethyltransferase RsmA [Bacillota bacterium]|nr:16S rRNA (adenine(1518)-N(6)/adenine(1519)-N(6))-dimethyltransferase RsmA [Bacillota bacterium]